MTYDTPAERTLQTQWQWHSEFRDSSKNMYRTTYSDGIHFREVNVANEYPSGYGGHAPRLRHDVLFNNTEQAATIKARSNAVNRDCHPSFDRQKRGLPTISAKERGPKFARVEYYPAPWAYCLPTTPSLTYNDAPPKMHVAAAAESASSSASSSSAPGAQSSSSASSSDVAEQCAQEE